ncbi:MULTISPECIES: hypothetical protein [unclassified Bartonella]
MAACVFSDSFSIAKQDRIENGEYG